MRTVPTASTASVAPKTIPRRTSRREWCRCQSMNCTGRVSRPHRTGSLARMQTLGAVPVDDERTTFRVWSPNAQRLAVRVGGQDEELSRADDGTWSGDIVAKEGDDYRFVVDGGAWPDPCSRFQPEGV